MKDEDKTKGQLIHDLQQARERISRLEKPEIQQKKSEELLNSLLSTSPIATYTVQRGKFIVVSPQLQKITGYGQAELLGMDSLNLVHPDDRDMVKTNAVKILKGERSYPYEFRLVNKRGEVIWILEMVAATWYRGERATLGNFMDITRQKQAEAALFEEKERLAITLRSIGDGVICTDKAGNIVLMNKVAEELTGWLEKESIGKSLKDVFHIINEKTRQPCENPVERVMETKGVVGLANHTMLISKDGTERILADSGAPIRNQQGEISGVVLVFRDVTEQKKLEKELQKVEKLESVGILAGGIAHDFNNILTGILGNISLAKMELHPDEANVIERLTDAEKACLQAKDLTQQLLTFSKGGAPVKKFASMPKLIKEAASFVLRGSNVGCEFSISHDLWPVEVDEGQISQVINNLIINADQAMPEGGVIKVRAENVLAEETGSLGLKPGKYIKLSIQDRGIGISEKNLSKIFDPYFSTKQKGSGLGLATAYSIIKNHDGDIRVESELGIGTTFYIYLPASEKHMVPMEEKQERLVAGKGKILIMDDEEMVRSVVSKMLKSIGYEICTATDGAEAIELYKKAAESGTPFDAVVMDLTIPGGMGAKEAIQRLLEIDPECKAIVSSGYSDDQVMSNYRQYGFRNVLKKPYRMGEMREVIHSVINP
jgi:PAS domain S-box-containing protein